MLIALPLRVKAFFAMLIQTVLHPQAGPLWNVPLSFRDVNPDGPVCIQVPGIRSQGMMTEENMEIAGRIADENISILSFDYGGCANWVKGKDPATLDTHIRDTKAVIDFTGDRSHILLSKSAGITMALAAANVRTKAIVASIPAPDLFQNLYRSFFAWQDGNHLHNIKRALTKIAFHALLETRGYYCWVSKSNKDRSVPFIKITNDFVKSTHHNYIEDVINRNPHKPPVHCIVNEGDRYNPELIGRLCDKLNAAGYNATMETIPGGGHSYTEGTKQAIIRNIRDLAL